MATSIEVHNQRLVYLIHCSATLQGVVTTILGFVLLGGVRFEPLNFSGIMINMAGGVWYSVVKYKQRQARLAASKAEEGDGQHAEEMPHKSSVAEQSPLLRPAAPKAHDAT